MFEILVGSASKLFDGMFGLDCTYLCTSIPSIPDKFLKNALFFSLKLQPIIYDFHDTNICIQLQHCVIILAIGISINDYNLCKKIEGIKVGVCCGRKTGKYFIT